MIFQLVWMMLRAPKQPTNRSLLKMFKTEYITTLGCFFGGVCVLFGCFTIIIILKTILLDTVIRVVLQSNRKPQNRKCDHILKFLV